MSTARLAGRPAGLDELTAGAGDRRCRRLASTALLGTPSFLSPYTPHRCKDVFTLFGHVLNVLKMFFERFYIHDPPVLPPPVLLETGPLKPLDP